MTAAVRRVIIVVASILLLSVACFPFTSGGSGYRLTLVVALAGLLIGFLVGLAHRPGRVEAALIAATAVIVLIGWGVQSRATHGGGGFRFTDVLALVLGIVAMTAATWAGERVRSRPPVLRGT